MSDCLKINDIISKQKSWFENGYTLDIQHRLSALKLIRSAIEEHIDEISNALFEDCGKSEQESYMTETGLVLTELDDTIKNLKKWAKPAKKPVPFSQFPASSYIMPSPRGTVLIIAPWNYPFQLAMLPLIGAIAAGNTVVLKPSELADKTAKLLNRLLSDIFEEEYIAVIEGDGAVSSHLTKAGFDFIFFTGSENIGRKVYSAAASTLTPVVLELGGKSPCIVADDADIPLTAKRIVWGKFLNAGQTCVAPDYLLIHNSVKAQFISCALAEIKSQYGENPLLNPDYPKIISKRHLDRLVSMIDDGRIICGGKFDGTQNKLEPTLIDDIDFDSKSMQEEIFGPILPIIGFNDISEVYDAVKKHPSPLALYLFTRNKSLEREIMSRIRFGGGCINDTIIHLTSSKLPFGGIGTSGIGAYHGYHSFSVFSHFKSIVKKSLLFDIPLRYPPYSEKSLSMVKRALPFRLFKKSKF